jgi:prepilin-type N-terminal cleavage/methylation domain-containing protein
MEGTNVAPRRARGGFSLIEVLIAAVIMAIAGVGVMTIFSQSSKSLGKSDAKREYRFYLREVLAHVNRQSLHKLYFHYAEDDAGGQLNSRLLGALALVDADGNMIDPQEEMTNPLGFTQAFMLQMHQEKLRGEIEFRFLERINELGYEAGEDLPSAQVGILHMQAGVAQVRMYQTFVYPDGSEEEREVAVVEQPIMCPAIVGRPGLKRSSCPAVNEDVQCAYLPILAAQENFEIPTSIENTCQNNTKTPEEVTLGQAS